jgi:hypothetical protein
MKTQDLIHKAFNSLKTSSEQLFLPNEYTPPRGQKGLRIAKTVQPSKRASFNEVYKNAKEQLL